MIISAIAGVLCSEGFYRCYESHSCPALIKKRFDPFVKNLETTSCIKIACMVIFGTILSRWILTAATKTLNGRLTILKPPLEKFSLRLGKYSRSIPFLVSLVGYFSRREAFYQLGIFLYHIYSKLEEIAAFFATAATEPSETVERIAQGLNEEILKIFGREWFKF